MKTKVIMKVEAFNFKDGLLLLSVNDTGLKVVIKNLVDKLKAKYESYIRLEMSPPYKARSTGRGSQNSLIWALIQQIVEYTGNEIEDVEDYIKQQAIKRGYPYRVNKLTGQMKPYSMTEIDTVQASYLIEELYKLGAELGINLDENA